MPGIIDDNTVIVGKCLRLVQDARVISYLKYHITLYYNYVITRLYNKSICFNCFLNNLNFVPGVIIYNQIDLPIQKMILKDMQFSLMHFMNIR